jgi:hemoglobin
VTDPYVPPQGPPTTRLDPALFRHMGRERIFAMIADLYAELEQSELRPMFPEDMPAASRRSAAFFVQVMGGAPLYSELYGAPMMRRRHLPFAIDAHARRVWLECFDRVLENAEERYGMPADLMPQFKKFLRDFSAWMVNRA